MKIEELRKWLKGNSRDPNVRKGDSGGHKIRKGIDDLVRGNLDYFYPESKEKIDYGEMLRISLLGSGKNAQISCFQSYFLKILKKSEPYQVLAGKEDYSCELYLVFTGKKDYADAGVNTTKRENLSGAGRKRKFFRKKSDGKYERRQDKLKVLSEHIKQEFGINPIYLYVQYEKMASPFNVSLFNYEDAKRNLKKQYNLDSHV